MHFYTARFLNTLYATLGLIFIPCILAAQTIQPDTMVLSVSKAESIFLQKNLTLLAAKYNIDINKALVEQAKVWDNPVINTDNEIYDGKFFRYKTTNGQQYGQVYLQVQQLIRTAGKIKKQTQLAQDNLQSSKAQFDDLMRGLKYELTTDLNALAQLQQEATIYRDETQSVQKLVSGMNEMFKLGNISKKEDVRIKALLFSLQNDNNDNLTHQYDIEKEIALMLQLNDKTWVVAEAVQPISDKQIDSLQISDLLDSAFQNRPDLLLVSSQTVFQQHNIAYQKALAKPDFTVGMEYDRLSSYQPNYIGLAFSIPLPLFNKNKGNISASELAYKQNGIAAADVKSQVDKDVFAAWQKLVSISSMLNADNLLLKDDYATLSNNMLESYRQRQVGLVEFIDFFDSYKDTRIKQMQLVTNQRNAAAELNYAVNKNIIKL